MATARFVLMWWLALFGWWVVLVGTNAGSELVAAGAAATLATLLAAALRGLGLLRFRFEASWLAKTLTVPWRVVQELVVVLWALAVQLSGRRRVGSSYVAVPFPAGGADPASAARRGVAVEADALGPNTLPVDIDCVRRVALRHVLDPRRASSELL